MSIEDPIEKQLTGIHLENYRKKCAAHPWYRDSQMLIEKWNAKIQACKDAGIDAETLFEDMYNLPVDEIIGYALAAQAQQDVWMYYVEQVEKLKTNPDAELNPEYSDISVPFQAWYFLHRGKPFQGFNLLCWSRDYSHVSRGQATVLDTGESPRTMR